jgi:hypothetical protein
MSRERKHISLTTKLASALCQMVRFDDEGKPCPVIPYDEAKTLSDAEILRRFDWDHAIVPHAEGGPDEAWNLRPVLREEHREKTAKIDVPQIAKGKRIRAKEKEFRRRLLAKDTGEAPDPVKPKRKWPSRKMTSRGGQVRSR